MVIVIKSHYVLFYLIDESIDQLISRSCNYIVGFNAYPITYFTLTFLL